MTDLNAETKARIRAEEEERAKVRAELAAPVAVVEQSGGGMGCAGWTITIVLCVVVFFACTAIQGSSSSSSSDSAPSEDTYFGRFGSACDSLVTESLKAPAGADVSNYYSDRSSGAATGAYAAGYQWNGYVDAENSFGAKIRTRFNCTSGPSEDRVHLKFDQR